MFMVYKKTPTLARRGWRVRGRLAATQTLEETEAHEEHGDADHEGLEKVPRVFDRGEGRAQRGIGSGMRSGRDEGSGDNREDETILLHLMTFSEMTGLGKFGATGRRPHRKSGRSGRREQAQTWSVRSAHNFHPRLSTTSNDVCLELSRRWRDCFDGKQKPRGCPDPRGSLCERASNNPARMTPPWAGPGHPSSLQFPC